MTTPARRLGESNCWLVLAVAGVNVGLGLVASEAAARRDDARTFFVSMALLASAGFLGLHALVTPGILLDHSTAGFPVAAPERARLGGEERKVSVLFADLAGFTAFSEKRPAIAELKGRHEPVPIYRLVSVPAETEWPGATRAFPPSRNRDQAEEFDGCRQLDGRA